ncbi:MAG: hypothetical protein R3296_02830, partial [Oleiphilaceae bacterium]|nr:hypothetical protein [Oleiphilaceae bacterium]
MNGIMSRAHGLWAISFSGALYGAMTLIVLCLSAATSAQEASEDAFSQTPLFLTDSAPENILFAFDDSRSLDFEMVLPETELGAMDQDSLRRWLGEIIPGWTETGSTLKEILLGDVEYGYLLEPGFNANYNSRRINKGYHVVPPLKLYAFLRSAEFNAQYYDPSVTYRPWPSVEGGIHAMPQASADDPLLDPVFSLKHSDAMKNTSLLGSLVSGLGDLLGFFLGDCESLFNWSKCPPPLLEVQYQPFAISGSLETALIQQFNTLQNVLVETVTGLQVGDLTESTACELDKAKEYFQGFGSLLDEEASTLGSRAVCMAHFPATYYVPVDNASYVWREAFSLTVQSGTCETSTNRESQADYEQFLEGFNENSLKFTDSNGNEFSGALAPDGTCLREVNLAQSWPTGKSGFVDVNAAVYARYGRTFAQELQNFANWYTYHRRRHHSLRATIGESAVRLDNSRGALMKSSESASPADIVMQDLTDRSPGGGLDQFLDQVYTAYNNVTAANHPRPRTLLKAAGEQ